MSMAHTSVNSVDHLWSQLLNLQHNLNPRLYHLPLPSNQSRQFLSLNDKTLRLINFIFCIISLVATCWAVIPLAWMIPMTVHSWGIYKGTKPNTTGFGVCTLIFVTLVGGILLLCSKKDK